MSQRAFLCTDLDGTLIPDGAAPESPAARPRLARLVAESEISLAFVTGRHRELVERAIERYSLPLPDLVIADVGSTIFEVTGDGWRPWRSWARTLAAEWKPGAVASLRSRLEGLEGLELQEESRQGEFKLSFHVTGGAEPVLAEVGERLRAGDLPARSIFSRDGTGAGLLDLLPPAAGKLAAVRFALARRGFDERRFLFAGDSGNDLEVLVSDLPAVLVANAGDEVKRQARRGAVRAGTEAALYQARGGFLGMNGNYSAGILEGVDHFLPDLAGSLR